MLGSGWTEAVALVTAFGIAMVTTPAGVSGEVLLLPFQVSVLGTPSPAVTPTNLLYNVIASPGALYRYWRQGRPLPVGRPHLGTLTPAGLLMPLPGMLGNPAWLMRLLRSCTCHGVAVSFVLAANGRVPWPDHGWPGPPAGIGLSPLTWRRGYDPG